MKLLGGTASHVGNVREANQDRVYFGGRLAALADGMGGHQGGERAAELAIGQFRRAEAELSESDLVDRVLAANRAVHGHAAENGLPGMGTTVVALTLHNDETITVANVGDSRAYWIRGDYMTQITEDHSFVEDLVRQGRLTPEEAAIHPQRNILTRAVGIGVEVEVDRFPVAEPAIGDSFLLCSDGLFNEVSEEEILEIVLEAPGPIEASARLVERTLQTPCRDNVTVAVVEVVDDDDPRLAAAEPDGHEVDTAVITSDYTDSDTNAITAPIPVITDDLIGRPDSAGPGVDNANGTGRSAGGGTDAGDPDGPTIPTPPSIHDDPPIPVLGSPTTGAANAAGVALADLESGSARNPGIAPDLIDDPEATLDTAEMDIFVDDPLEVRPRSRAVLYLGSLLLIAGLAAGGYFLALTWATSGFHLAEDDSTSRLAVFEGRRGGLFGLFEPSEMVYSTDHPYDVLITHGLDTVADQHFGSRVDVDAMVAEIDAVVALAAEAESLEVDAGGVPSDGTSEGADGSGSNQSVEGETVVREGVSSDGADDTPSDGASNEGATSGNDGATSGNDGG